MSRRLRTQRAAVVAMKRETASLRVELHREPEDGPEADDFAERRCYVCGARQEVADSGCCGIDGERAECPWW